MASKGSWVVIAHGSGASMADIYAFGPFGSEEKADKARHEIRAEDGNLHEFKTVRLLDPDETVEAETPSLYEEDKEKVVLRDLAVEQLEKEEAGAADKR